MFKIWKLEKLYVLLWQIVRLRKTDLNYHQIFLLNKSCILIIITCNMHFFCKCSRPCQWITSLSHFWWTETVTVFMLCFNICFIHGYKIAHISSHSLIRYWMSNIASNAKAYFSSKVEYRAVIRYLYLECKTGKEIHGEIAYVYGFSAPSYAQVKFWVGEFKRGRMSLKMKPGLDARWMPPPKKCVRKFGIWYTLIGEFRWKK